MTKRRVPLSIDAGITRVAGQLPDGFTDLAKILDRSVSLVRKWADPDTREEIPLRDAIKADLIYRENGGEGSPMFECFANMLDEAGARHFADEIALGKHVQTLIRESNEANAAVVAASQPGVNAQVRARARREVQQSIEASRTTLQLLDGGAGDLEKNACSPALKPP